MKLTFFFNPSLLSHLMGLFPSTLFLSRFSFCLLFSFVVFSLSLYLLAVYAVSMDVTVLVSLLSLFLFSLSLSQGGMYGERQASLPLMDSYDG